MAFDALDASLALVPHLKKPVARIARCDRSLATQIRRAAASVALNLAEGRRRIGGDRLQSWRVAAGSNAECRAALEVAIGWGWIRAAEVAEAMALHDRLAAMLHRMTRS